MNPPRPIPFGFVVVAEKPNAELIREFRCSTAQIKRWRTELGIHVNRCKAGRAVWQLDGNRIIKYHKTLTDAARSVRGHSENICLCANGKIPSAYGFRWKYVE